jgi:hypothetical protein
MSANPRKSGVVTHCAGNQFGDELNRANLSRVFGELMYLLKYRNKKIPLSIGGEEFQIPKNVFIIGTMSAINIPSACRIANINPNDAMILPHDANPARVTFSERTS